MPETNSPARARQPGTDVFPPTRTWGDGKTDPVAAAVAQRLGVSYSTSERFLLEAPPKVAVAIEEFHAARVERRLARWLVPIRVAELGIEVRVVGSDDYASVHAAYADYVAAENRYRRLWGTAAAPTVGAERSDPAAQAYLRAIDRLESALLRVRLGIKQRHQLGAG